MLGEARTEMDVNMNESIWPVMIKADDMTYGPSQPAWTRLVALVQEEDAHVDIGFIFKPDASSDAIQAVRAWDASMGRHGYSFFNHGRAHTRDEFIEEGVDFDAVFRQLRQFEFATFGEALNGFGAPFNSHCEAALASYQRMDSKAFVYYPDIENRQYAGSWQRAISFDYHVSFERKDEGYDPSFDYFRRSYARKIDALQPMVLQIHPRRWSAKGFEEFRKILTLLRERGATFVTPQRFIASTAATRQSQRRSELELKMHGEVKHLGLWFESRYDATELDRTRAVIERTLGGTDISGDAVLDFGCGAGDWLYLLAERFGFRRLYGVDPSPAIAQAAQAALGKVPGVECRIFVAKMGDPLEGIGPVSLTVCNRALTYIRVVDYLKAIAAVDGERTLHFIGCQTFMFYWTSFTSALKRGDADMARRRATVIRTSLEYRVGLWKSGAGEHFMSVRDLIAAASAGGYQLVRQTPVDSDNEGNVRIDGLGFRRRAHATELRRVHVDCLGLAQDLSAMGADVEVSSQPPLALVEAIRALSQRRFPEALVLLPAHACTPEQAAMIVARALALHGAGRMDECKAWLVQHRQVAF